MNKQKITLIYEDTGPKDIHGIESIDHRVTHEIMMDGVDWNQMIQHYINFLRGIGYHIPDHEDRV